MAGVAGTSMYIRGGSAFGYTYTGRGGVKEASPMLLVGWGGAFAT